MGPEWEVLAPEVLRREVAADMIAEAQPEGGLGDAEWRIRLLRNLCGSIEQTGANANGWSIETKASRPIARSGTSR